MFPNSEQIGLSMNDFVWIHESNVATIDFKNDAISEVTEDIMNDVAHELMIEELKQYLPTNNP